MEDRVCSRKTVACLDKAWRTLDSGVVVEQGIYSEVLKMVGADPMARPHLEGILQGENRGLLEPPWGCLDHYHSALLSLISCIYSVYFGTKF